MANEEIKKIYWTCDECGNENSFTGDDTEVICSSCGSRIASAQLTRVREELENTNVPAGFENSSSLINMEEIATIAKPEFVMEQQKLIRYNGTASRVLVPSAVNEISPSAFAGCESLQEVSFPDMINRIPQSAFEGCVNLQKVTLPENLYRIDTNAFKGCTGLKEIQLPASVRIIEDGAFSGVNSLNYETLFKNNVQYGSALNIADAQLAKQYQTVLKTKGKTDEKPKRKIPSYLYAIATVILLIGVIFIKMENDFSRQIQLAESDVRFGFYELGISEYEAAMRIKNHDERARIGIDQAYKSWGDSLLADGRHEEAIDKYSQILSGREYIENAYLKWGDDLRVQGRYEEAIEKYFCDGNSLNWHSLQYVEETYLEWADIFVEKSDFEHATKILEKGKETLSYYSYESDEIDDRIADLKYKAK